MPRTFALLILPFLLLPAARAQDPRAFPAHVQESGRAELLHNAGIDERDLWFLVRALLRLEGKSVEEATALATAMPKEQVRALATRPFDIQYFELPEALAASLGKAIGGPVAGAGPFESPMRFERGGTRYLRYFIHPGNEKPEIEELIRRAGDRVPAEFRERRSGGFKAVFTSSRSVYLHDSRTGAMSSTKLSLPEGIGPFQDKKFQAEGAAKQARVSEHLLTNLKGPLPRGTGLITDSDFMGIRAGDIDVGQSARRMRAFEAGHLVLPAAVIFDPELSDRIVAASGGKDAPRFWGENVMSPLGELAAKAYHDARATHVSLHSQNVVIIVDRNYRFLRTEIRDMDFNLSSSDHDLNFSLNNFGRGVLTPKPPSWLTPEVYSGWVTRFFDSFGEGLERLSGRRLPFRASRVAREDLGSPGFEREQHYVHSRRAPPPGQSMNHFRVRVSDLANPPAEVLTASEYQAMGLSRQDPHRDQILLEHPHRRGLIENPADAVLELIERGDLSALKPVKREAKVYLDLGLAHLAEEQPAAGVTESRLDRIIREGNPAKIAVIHRIARFTSLSLTDAFVERLILRPGATFQEDLAFAFVSEKASKLSSRTRILFVDRFGADFFLDWADSTGLYRDRALMEHVIAGANLETLVRLAAVASGERAKGRAFHHLVKYFPAVEERIEFRRRVICVSGQEPFKGE